MNTLGVVTLCMGCALFAGAAAALAAPVRMRALLTGLPRNRPLGWGLTAVALAWGARLLWLTPLGRFEWLKPWLMALLPVAFVLIVYAMDELLAARALGALMVLIPAPVLALARWHPSSWRLVTVVAAYAMAVLGMTLTMGPYLFGQWTRRCAAAPAAWRAAAVAFGAAGLLLMAVAVFVY